MVLTLFEKRVYSEHYHSLVTEKWNCIYEAFTQNDNIHAQSSSGMIIFSYLYWHNQTYLAAL